MNTYNECVLIVEDDQQIRNYIIYALKNEGIPYESAATGAAATSILLSEKIDVMLLDLGLPDMDGMDIIHQVREWSELPIIVVSARDQDKEKVAALDAGADDYLTKPFSATELLARLRVALRHMRKMNGGTAQSSFSVGELTLDLNKRLTYLHGEEIHLTPMEYSLLSLLFKNIGKVLTTSFIQKQLWGVAYGTDTQALRTLMAGLRRKIEENPATPRYIMTEIGVGYRLADT